MQDVEIPVPANAAEAQALVDSVEWYHSIDVGYGIVTPGHYDHRPFLPHYRLPERLDGKTALDIGAAAGFFSFELEQRGAAVTATDLPEWFDHDFGPNYQPDHSEDTGQQYLHRPFDIARALRGSKARRKLINIYDIAPETVGTYDFVFCGSVLCHLTDPLKALWNIAGVTREKAIISTIVARNLPNRSVAEMVGYHRGDGWWFPTPACLELMCVTAGFMGVEWVSEFDLTYRDGSPGPYHGVVHAYKTTEGWTPGTLHRDAIIAREEAQPPLPDVAQLLTQLRARDAEIAWLRGLVRGYERGRVMRLLGLLHASRDRLAAALARYRS
jgi:tRNA (mo5U34)-methyltransferase